MPTRTMNTMAEGLTSLAQMLTDLKFAPDADIPWLIQLETEVLRKSREMQPQPSELPPPPMPQGGGAPVGPGGGGADIAALMGMPAGPPGMGGGMVPPPPALPGGVGPVPMTQGGGLQGRAPINGDEIGRLLGSGPPRGGRYG